MSHDSFFVQGSPSPDLGQRLLAFGPDSGANFGNKEVPMTWSSILPTFLASIVEFVEALTIVMVVGTTINWKSSLLGAAAAVATLTVTVLIVGSAFVFVPLGAFRLFVGFILVLFGLKWLKKALLRYSGLKALHDEEAIYEEEAALLRSRGEVPHSGVDGFGLATSFKSVLLEGMEVVFIVLTFGTSSATTEAGKSAGIATASLGALLALVVVIILGLAIRKPLTKVPENTLKFVVGLMLTTFGTFWGGEGLGIEWPSGDWSLLVLLSIYALASWALVVWMKRKKEARS